MMPGVFQAEAYRSGAMGSLRNASYMLIRQHQFPDTYDGEKDKLIGWDHDRIMQQEHKHGTRCFQKHMQTGEMGLQDWCQRVKPELVMALLKDLLHADESVIWTGFRILGTVHRGNGYPVWTLELFSKHPESATQVFDTKNAPNLKGHRVRGERISVW
jgi:hypothetical protein